MATETLNKLYAFSEQLGHNPSWINDETRDTFVIPTELSDGSFIKIRVLQEGERLIYQVPFQPLPNKSDQKMKILVHFMEINQISQVITALIDNTIYLTFSQPVTYDEKLDAQLFIEARYNIARFYEENQENLLTLEG